MSSKSGLRWSWLALTMMALAILACGSTAATASPPTEAAPPVGSTDDSGGALVSVEIINELDVDICEAYVAAEDESTWGPNQLDDPIAPGDSFTLNNIPEGVYDLQTVDCDGNTLEESFGEDLAGQDFTWTIDTIGVALTVNNNSTSIACRVFLSEPGATDLGPNIMDEGAKLNPNESITLTGITAGTYDIHAETCSANYTWDFKDFELTADAEINLNN